MAAPEHHLFGRIALEETDITEEQLKECVQKQKKERHSGETSRKLGQIMVEKGYLTSEQVQNLLTQLETTGNRRFGEIAMNLHLITFDQLKIANTIQKHLKEHNTSPPLYGQPLRVYEQLLETTSEDESPPAIGKIMMELGYLTEKDVQKVLDSQEPEGEDEIEQCPRCKEDLNLHGFDHGSSLICGSCSTELTVKNQNDTKYLTLKESQSDRLSSEEWEEQSQDFEGQMLDDYWVEKVVGQDSTGAIFRTYEVSKERKVALKLYHPDSFSSDSRFLQRLASNAKKLASVECNNLRHIYKIGTIEEKKYVSMEWLEGESLYNFMRREKKVIYHRATEIALGVINGLQAGAKHGIYHGDIRPSHIIILDDGRIKLCNLGLIDNPLENIREIAGQNEPVPNYIAPELILYPDRFRKQCDMYSLGACLYHMITGSPPVQGHYPFESLIREMNDQLPAPHRINPNIPEFLSKTIMRLLSPDPEERHNSYKLLKQDLQKSYDDLGEISESSLSMADSSADMVSDSELDISGGQESSSAPSKSSQRNFADDSDSFQGPITEDTSTDNESSFWERQSTTTRWSMISLGLLAIATGGLYFFSAHQSQTAWKSDFQRFQRFASSHPKQVQQVKKQGKSLKQKYPDQQKLHSKVRSLVKKIETKRQKRLENQYTEFQQNLKKFVQNKNYSRAVSLLSEYKNRFQNTSLEDRLSREKKKLQNIMNQDWNNRVSEMKDLADRKNFQQARQQLDSLWRDFEDLDKQKELHSLKKLIDRKETRHKQKLARKNIDSFFDNTNEKWSSIQDKTARNSRRFKFSKAIKRLKKFQSGIQKKRKEKGKYFASVPEKEWVKKLNRIKSEIQLHISLFSLQKSAWENVAKHINSQLHNLDEPVHLTLRKGNQGTLLRMFPKKVRLRIQQGDQEKKDFVKWHEIERNSLSHLLRAIKFEALSQESLYGLAMIYTRHQLLHEAHRTLIVARNQKTEEGTKKKLYQNIQISFRQALRDRIQKSLRHLEAQLKQKEDETSFINKYLRLRSDYMDTDLHQELDDPETYVQKVDQILQRYYQKTLGADNDRNHKVDLYSMNKPLPKFLNFTNNQPSRKDGTLELPSKNVSFTFPWNSNGFIFWLKDPNKRVLEIEIGEEKSAAIQFQPAKESVTIIHPAGVNNQSLDNWLESDWNRFHITKKKNKGIALYLNGREISLFQFQSDSQELKVQIKFRSHNSDQGSTRLDNFLRY